MTVIIKLTDEKAGMNHDEAFNSERMVLKKNLVSVVPYGNDFVTGLIRAYHHGLHLCSRLEDIWLSILSQLRVYGYRNPGSVPGLSSSHYLNIDLSIDLETDPKVFDFTRLEEKLAVLANIFIDDVTLRDGITLNFTTTTTTDKSVASVVMMGELQKLTEPSDDLCPRAGPSSVALLGKKSDWQEILHRVERVPIFGQQATEWCRGLVPVIKEIISSFESPERPQSKDFWGQACHFDNADTDNDKETLTGWNTTFCFLVRLWTLSSSGVSR